MDFSKFQKYSKELVADYINNRIDVGPMFKSEDVYVVWYAKTLGNAKALLSTHIEDGRYYEATYNGNTKEIYLDSYVKEYNQAYTQNSDGSWSK